MKEWWRHHQGKVPNFEDEDDRMMVQDLTGCIPLLLRPLLQWSNQDFRDIEQNFRNHQDISAVQQNIQGFADSKTKGSWEYEQ